MAQLSIRQTFAQAQQRHQAGKLQEAEQLYRQILARQPKHAEAMQFLGLLANQLGQSEAAVELIRRSIAISPNSAGAYNNLGIVYASSGRLDDAIAAYRRAVELGYKSAEFHSNLGIALNGNKQFEEAIVALRTAVALRPGYAEAHYILGNALAKQGQFDDAIVAYRRVTALRPNYPEAFCSLGIALREKKEFDEAIAAYRRAVALRPNYAEAHNNLGIALRDKGLLDEAIAACRAALAVRADFPDALGNLGNALKDKGQLDDAIAAYNRLIVLRPELAEAHSNLGMALRDKGLLAEAVVAGRRAVALNPNLHESYNNLGNALKDNGVLDEAVAAFRQAIALRPDYADGYSNLGNSLKDQGKLDEAIAAYRKALALRPDSHGAHSNIVYLLPFHPAYDAAAIAEENRRWNNQHAEPFRQAADGLSGTGMCSHPNDRTPDRRLRVGYVSPDFRQHVVGRNVLPLICRHDRREVEIFCYAQVLSPDAMTDQFRQNADGWRNINGMTDEQVAAQIQRDGIDVLVDLTLHMAHNRMLVFARKPAPVQVTFAGYPGSTGLSAIDYRLSDPYLDPPEMDESVYTEKTIRLPDSFWCYDAQECHDVPVNPLPALETKTITFGCLNNFCKINDGVLANWVQVLRQVENSRLMLMAHPGSHRQCMSEWFTRQGINPSRIEFVGMQTRPKYLRGYHRIDLGLDTFPYNGHTTSLDSFWMGVPVVTLVGKTAVSRAGWCQLSNLGLQDLAAQTPEQFVKIAVELARNLQGLVELRSTLRQRMEGSPLMDAPKFARNIELAYRRMWRAWCEPHSGGAVVESCGT